MTIGIDASRANCPELTGTERYAFEVIRRLPGLRPTVQWILYVRESLHPRWGTLPNNVTVKVLDWPPRWLWTHLRLGWELLRRRPDALFVPVGALPLWPDIPSITTVHDIGFERYPQLYRQPVIRVSRVMAGLMTALIRMVTLGRYGFSQLDYQRWSLRRALRADIVLTVSEFSRQECSRLFGAESGRMVITHLGVDQAEHPSESPLERRAWLKATFGITRPYAIVLGRLEMKKNIDGVLAAYAAIERDHAGELDLVLAGPAGDGWDRQRHEIPNGWIGRQVHVLGFVEENDRLRLLRGADLLLMVSRYEGFGLPVIEAFVAGVPVVASLAGALPEVAGPGAVFVDPEQPSEIAAAVWDVHSNSALRKGLIQAGRHQVTQFTWDMTATKTAKAIDRIRDLRDTKKSGRVDPA